MSPALKECSLQRTQTWPGSVQGDQAAQDGVGALSRRFPPTDVPFAGAHSFSCPLTRRDSPPGPRALACMRGESKVLRYSCRGHTGWAGGRGAARGH